MAWKRSKRYFESANNCDTDQWCKAMNDGRNKMVIYQLAKHQTPMGLYCWARVSKYVKARVMARARERWEKKRSGGG